jgi:Ser-tRNA(Ala) deacylase AlaX
MTNKAFWEDPYASTHRTMVTAVDGDTVELASTIFFAFSGGQESDHGSIGGVAVVEATREGRRIRYRLAAGHGLQPGQPVEVAIDWARRYRLMRLHFAAELVLELAGRALPGAIKVGAHIAADKARIDFRWPESIAPLLPELAASANRIVAADLPILTAFEDVENERRYWEIAGFSRVACGGTHVRSTGEVGPLRLKRNNIGKGKERIEIFLAGD